MHERTRRDTFLALVGVLTFAATMLLLELLAGARDDSPRYISNFAERPGGWLWTLGLLVLGFSVALFTHALGAFVPDNRVKSWGIASLWVIVLGIALIALVPSDGDAVAPTPVSGARPHYAIVTPTFAALSLAPLLLGFAWRSDPHTRPVAMLSMAFSGLLLVGGVAFTATHFVDEQASGLAERITVALALAWLAVVAAWVHRESLRDLRTGAD